MCLSKQVLRTNVIHFSPIRTLDDSELLSHYLMDDSKSITDIALETIDG